MPPALLSTFYTLTLDKPRKPFNLSDWGMFGKPITPIDCDYTFYSRPHDSYYKVDYVMTSHALLLEVNKTFIGTQTISDHALDLCLGTPQSKPWIWKLNDSLVQESL